MEGLDASQEAGGVDLDNFRFGELFADYVRWNRVKNSRGPFSSRNKGKEGRGRSSLTYCTATSIKSIPVFQ